MQNAKFKKSTQIFHWKSSIIFWFASLLAFPMIGHAQFDLSWTGEDSNRFFDIGNWDLQVAPSAEDDVFFDLAGSHDVLIDGFPLVRSMDILNGNFRFLSDGQPRSVAIRSLGTGFGISAGASLTLGQAFSNRVNLQTTNVFTNIDGNFSVLNGSSFSANLSGIVDQSVSLSSTGLLNVSNGTFGAHGMTIEGTALFQGGASGHFRGLSIGNFNTGMLQVGGSSTQVTVDDTFRQNSVLSVRSGGVLNTNNTTVSDSSFTESAIEGVGSRWENTGSFIFADSDRANMTISDSGNLVTNGGIVANQSTSVADIRIENAGSEWNNNGRLSIGYRGEGTVSLDQQGELNSNRVILGEFGSGHGTINVTGSGSQLNASDLLNVGGRGQGTLNILSDGVVNALTPRIGNRAGSNGVINVSGFGSRLESSEHINVGVAGRGELNISAGGVVNNIVGRLGLDEGGLGIANVEGVGTRWNNSGNINVGLSGNGVLNIRSGGNTNNTIGYVGVEDGTGTVNVSDVGSHWENRRDLILGNDGTGNLTITSQGQVTNRAGRMANRSGSGATAFILGSGSSWENNGMLIVGVRGGAILGADSGGDVSSNGGIIADGFGSSGLAQFTGSGSTWNNSGNLTVGRIGDGSLAISSGARVDNLATTIGSQGGASGVATVQGRSLRGGTGSRWAIAGDLTVGRDGTGEMNIESGGVVSNHFGIVAENRGSSAEITVIEEGSLWSNSGDLTLGGSFNSTGGVARLNIFHGGRVDVLGGTTSIGIDSSVRLHGGSFNFNQMQLEDFSRIEAISGSMNGSVNNEQVLDVGELVGLQGLQVNYSNVDIRNAGRLTGNAIMNSGLTNTAAGEIQVAAGDQMRFGEKVINNGMIGNNGGVFRVDARLDNRSGALMTGNGTFMSDDFVNRGTIALSGDSNLRGDLRMLNGSRLITSGNSTTTIWDDLVHNGDEIRTGAGSATVMYGSVSGSGVFTGAGQVFFEGDLDPGNSPGTLMFEGDVALSQFADVTIEFAGIESGEFDQLLVAGDLSLAGNLQIELLDDFELTETTEFLIAEVGGQLTGQFNGLNEGDKVGRFGAYDFSISYQAGNGNDIALTALYSIPEPSAPILVFGAVVATLYRRRFRKPRQLSS